MVKRKLNNVDDHQLDDSTRQEQVKKKETIRLKNNTNMKFIETY